MQTKQSDAAIAGDNLQNDKCTTEISGRKLAEMIQKTAGNSAMQRQKQSRPVDKSPKMEINKSKVIDNNKLVDTLNMEDIMRKYASLIVINVDQECKFGT